MDGVVAVELFSFKGWTTRQKLNFWLEITPFPGLCVFGICRRCHMEFTSSDQIMKLSRHIIDKLLK
jgi:hypothetical protein